jgi:hypothetical protein
MPWSGNRAVLSCHCFAAVCGRPIGYVRIEENLWAAWIEDYFRQEEEDNGSSPISHGTAKRELAAGSRLKAVSTSP